MNICIFDILFIRQARVGNLINWNFEGKVGFVKDFLQRLWKLLRLKVLAH